MGILKAREIKTKDSLTNTSTLEDEEIQSKVVETFFTLWIKKS